MPERRPPRPPPRFSRPPAGGGGDRGRYAGRPSSFRDRPPPRLPRRPSPDIDVIHSDDRIVVVSKPPGQAVTPGPDDRPGRSLAEMLMDHPAWTGPWRGPPGRIPRPITVNQLEQEASGLVLFARRRDDADLLAEQFRTRRSHRVWHALVERSTAAGPAATLPESATHQSELRIARDGLARPARPPLPGKKAPPMRREAGVGLATTHYRVIAAGPARALVQIRPETSWPGQPRAHMAELGWPVVGDAAYGAATNPLNRLGLHLSEIGFTHPHTGLAVRYHSPAPPSFRACAEAADAEAAAAIAPAATAWSGKVATWYDALLEEGGSDHFASVILPGVVRLLGDVAEKRILDVASGQGMLGRLLADAGASVVGVEASPELVAAAAARAGQRERYIAADARRLAALLPADEPFDAATCVMALTNIDPIEPVLEGASRLLRPGAPLVAVISHPAFRIMGRSSWGWGEEPPRRDASPSPGKPQPAAVTQFRRIDAYMSPEPRQIVMHPGSAPDVTTTTFHRPVSFYVNAFGAAGLAINHMEEWTSTRQSEPGPRADAENRARREFPLFLAIRALKQ